MNVVTVMGRLTRDVESRTTTTGKELAKTALAIKDWKKVVFVDITLWGPRAAAFAKYHKKGDMACVTGRLSMDEWEDSEGRKRKKLYITVGDWSFTGQGETPGKEEVPF